MRWLFVLIVAMEFFGVAHHHHAINAAAADCAACAVAANLSGSAPTATAASLPTLVAYRIGAVVRLPVTAQPVTPSFLLPFSQAPPAG